MRIQPHHDSIQRALAAQTKPGAVWNPLAVNIIHDSIEYIMETQNTTINALEIQAQLQAMHDKEVASEQVQADLVAEFATMLKTALGPTINIYLSEGQTKWKFPISGFSVPYSMVLDIIWERGPYWDLTCRYHVYEGKTDVDVSAYDVVEFYNIINSAMQSIAPDIRPLTRSIVRANMAPTTQIQPFRTNPARRPVPSIPK